jgi:Protein of unknown function (DUF3810)
MHTINGMRWRAGIVTIALGAAFVPLPASAVRRWYSAGLYASLQPALTSLSNLVPFSLLDLLIAAAAIGWIALAARDLARSPGHFRAALRILVRTLVFAAVLYLLFLVLWGLNYRRPSMRDTLPYDASAVTAGAAAAAGRLTTERLNALHDAAHAAGWPIAGKVDASLAVGFARALRESGIGWEVVPGRPKRTILDWYFRSAGVEGMTDPFFLETLVAGNVLPFERAFVVAHEWSHLAGIADEGEANFLAWRSCVSGSTADAYSGWLFLFGELARVVPKQDREALSAGLGAGPRADLRAIRDRYARDVNRRVSDAGWRLYDSYLKANRVEAGTASYDEVVRLVLGVRVDGRPVLDVR